MGVNYGMVWGFITVPRKVTWKVGGVGQLLLVRVRVPPLERLQSRVCMPQGRGNNPRESVGTKVLADRREDAGLGRLLDTVSGYPFIKGIPSHFRVPALGGTWQSFVFRVPDLSGTGQRALTKGGL